MIVYFIHHISVALSDVISCYTMWSKKLISSASDSSEYIAQLYELTSSAFVWVCQFLISKCEDLNFVTSRLPLPTKIVHFCIQNCVLRRAFSKFATLCVFIFCYLCVFELYWKFNLFRFFASTIRECRDTIAFVRKSSLSCLRKVLALPSKW